MIKRLYLLLPQKFRRKIIPISCTLLVKTVLDLFSLAVLIPFLLLLFDRQQARDKLGFDPDTATLAWLLALLVVAIVIKWVAKILLDRYQSRTVLELYEWFSRNMFRSYFERGLQFVRSHTASELAYKVNTICYAFCLNVLLPSVALVTEITVTVAILVAVVAVSPYSALTLILSVLPAAVIYAVLVKKQLSKYGEKEMKSRSKAMHLTVDTFRGYPDMVVNELFGKQDRSLEKLMRDVTKCRIDYSSIMQVPGGLMELSIIICLGILVLLDSSGQFQIGLTLAFMGVAVIRIVPAIKGIIGTWGTIRNSRFTSETVLEAMEQLKSTTEASHKKSDQVFSSLDIENLEFSYEKGRELYGGLSFSVNRGDRVAICGPSGAGKSTLFNILLGLLEPVRGCVSRMASDSNPISLKTWHEMIGYVPQDVCIFHATIAENVAIGLEFEYDGNGKPVLDETETEYIMSCLDSAQIGDYVRSLPDGIMTVLGDAGTNVSGGQKQRIGISRALWKNPQLLFFDEATSSLDADTERSLTQSINELSKARQDLTMVFISHRESLVENCPKKIILTES